MSFSMLGGPPSTTSTSSSRSSIGSVASSSSLAANGKYYNPVVMSFIRDDWVQQQLRLRQHAYTAFQKTSVVVGTWNVNAKKPLAQAEAAKILLWIQQQQQASGSPQALPDIIALGFQEIVDLNAVNVVVNSTVSAQRSSAWEESILYALNNHLVGPQQQQKYKVVMEKHLVGILLLVFVKSEHFQHVKEERGATAGVGIMGMMGNKGGAAIRMNFYDSTLCFVCAHLAAHRENVSGRNSDYANILSKVEFADNDDGYGNDTSSAALSPTCCFVYDGDVDDRLFNGEPAILNHDFVFWLGDLNYRINEDIPTEAVFQHAESGVYTELLQRDQLIIERKRCNVLHGFEEGPIKFPPTYKYQAGTSMYEKRPEKKLRAPAWCDRILWKAKLPEQVMLKHYNAVSALDLSDHKPVHAFFDVEIRHQVEAKKNQVLREIMMQLDKWENENMPKVRLIQSDGVQLSSGMLGYTHLKYGLDQTKTLFVENTGVVVAHFRFIPKLEETLLCKPWLSVSPTFGMIPPKEKMEIRITAHVNEAVAHGLTSGTETLDDTMILRVENGRDYFLVISGQYDNSCFGNSLEQLVVNSEPVRQVKHLLANAAGSSMFSVGGSGLSNPILPQSQRAEDPSNAQKIPKELWRMVNDIYQNYMNEKNLFVEAGNKQEVAILREALDTGRAFPAHSGYSTAELLIGWLQSLRQSVVPNETLTNAVVAGNGNVAQSCCVLLDGLPPVRFNVVVYLVSFLKELLKHRNTNKLTPEKLAFVFSRCLVSQCRISQDLNLMQGTSSGDSSQPSSSPPYSGSSNASTASCSSNQTSMLLPEDKLRRNAREIEIAQWNATQRGEKMEHMLLHMITTSTL
uniref:Rho-GAP domain-containing protein n=1 Tax=Globisporangium ultimum (strain ATCC 200006 / CBS 805.95 / DAOM BR144) TaxID=431595 RepID=K3W5H2_GLOUD